MFAQNGSSRVEADVTSLRVNRMINMTTTSFSSSDESDYVDYYVNYCCNSDVQTTYKVPQGFSHINMNPRHAKTSPINRIFNSVLQEETT